MNFEKDVLGVNLAFVDFYSPSCRPCNTMAPVFKSLADEYAGKIDFVKINSDDDFEIALSQNISALPTFILYKNGQEVERFLGVKSVDFIKTLLNKYVE